MERLKDKICIVTGVSEPDAMGFGIAKVFARESATVVCVVRRSIVFDRVKELTEAGSHSVGYVADLSKADEVNDMVKKVLDQFGKIDVLVNNAGGNEIVSRPLIETTERDWDKVFDANLRTCTLCTKAVLPSMVKHGRGKIVNISSVTGPMVTLPWSAAYSASKGAVSAFTRAMALEVAEYGITVNSICPGWILTRAQKNEEMIARSIPMKRWGKPEDVGYLALFLSTDESNYITGQDIVIDGGNIIQEIKSA